MAAVEPGRLVSTALSEISLHHPIGGIVAAGKAAWPMLDAALSRIPPCPAVVAAPGAGSTASPAVEAFVAGHPAPTSASVLAGGRALALARGVAEGQVLLVLLSGGASALLALPAADIPLEDKIEASRRLMYAGADIAELNTVRKHLSSIKGGRLAVAAGRTVTLALSDVHGPIPDDPAVIGSGPTVADPTTYQDALRLAAARGADLPSSVRAHLTRGARGEVDETPKPGDARLAASRYHVIGNRHSAMAGAAAEATARGYRVVRLDDATNGEAREAGRAFCEAALSSANTASRPCCVIASGETTVTVRGSGLGGRNQEFALGAAGTAARYGPGLVVASAGTDGVDGPTPAAGALVDATTLERARARGLSVDRAFAENSSYAFFEALSDLVVWGPTGTNVGDLHVLLLA